MKSILFSVLIIAAAVAVSCGSGSRSGITESGLVEIDVSAEYPAEEIVLQTVADVEYVPLAISKEVLLSPSDRLFYLSDRYIMAATSRGTGNIFVFDRKGKIVSHFNHRGRGPGEYISTMGIVFDEAAGELFVVDNPSASKIEVYSLFGEHLRTLNISGSREIKIYNLDRETLLVNDWGQDDMGKMGSTPFYLISKADGSIAETLNIEMPVRYSNRILSMVTDVSGRKLYQPVELGIANHRFGARDLTLADISSDTVYRYSRERVLTPEFVRTPSVHAAEPRVVWSAELVSEKFVVFQTTTLDFELAKAGTYPPARSLMYDRATGRITEPKFTDENNRSASWKGAYYDTEAHANTAVQMLDPLKLTGAHEKGELSGPLAETAAALKEDDNPVVMIVKFR